MPEKLADFIALLMYIIAAISGGLGGCVIASHSLIRGYEVKISYFIAYGIIGVAFGVLAFSYGQLFGVNPDSLDSVIANSIIVGAVGSIVLASTNISARWILKRLGIEVQVTVTRTEDAEKKCQER